MKNEAKSAATTLKRCMGLRETVTLTAGTVIGVGLFTVGANVVGLMGPWVILATLAALGISIYPAMLYAEMGASFPLSGGTYQYATLGLSRPLGMLAGWNFIISMVSVASGEALAFSFYLRTLCETAGFALPISDTALACLAILCFLALGLHGTELSSRMQNGFLFFFWGVAIVWLLSLLPKLHVESFAPAFAGPQLLSVGFLPCVALVWWCFAGFETCCAMGEEIRHPQLNLPRALFLAPVIVFAVTGLFQWALLCIVPSDQLSAVAAAAAPYAEGMRQAGILGFPLLLLCAGIAFGGDFSTLNATVSAPARYLYTMAKDGVIPAFFGRLSRRRTPYIAILTLGALMLLLVATDSLAYIANLSLFATLFYYIIGILAAWGLRKKYPNQARSYRAPGLAIGVPVSILLYLLMIAQLEIKAVLAGLLWCALGLLIYFLSGARKRPIPDPPPLPDLPQGEERLRLDRQFHRWRFVVITAAFLVLAIYLSAFLFAG